MPSEFKIRVPLWALFSCIAVMHTGTIVLFSDEFDKRKDKKKNMHRSSVYKLMVLVPWRTKDVRTISSVRRSSLPGVCTSLQNIYAHDNDVLYGMLIRFKWLTKIV